MEDFRRTFQEGKEWGFSLHFIYRKGRFIAKVYTRTGIDSGERVSAGGRRTEMNLSLLRRGRGETLSRDLKKFLPNRG